MPTPAQSAAPTALVSPAGMLTVAEDASYAKVTSHPMKSFLLGLTGGAWIAFAFVFYTTTQIGAEALPYGVAKLMGGLVFSIGLILVVITGAELFTSTTLALVPKASGRITWAQLLRNWAVVYTANFIGSLIVVTLAWYGGLWHQAQGRWGAVILNTAHTKLSHTFTEALVLGILCNILVCAGIWMTYAGRTVTDKIAAIVLPVALFVSTGFEHSVANMFLIPLAITIKNHAGADYWTTTTLDPTTYTNLTWNTFLTTNLTPVTIGNIIGGGIMIGLFYWLTHTKYGHTAP